MVRTQIQLTEEQSRQLRRMAAQRGVSLARLIRECIEYQLRNVIVRDESEQRHRAIMASGSFSSKEGDLSEKHDQYLAEAYGQ
jgi:16S rRNA U516 pseudouridylate synthase RsuA-like enzyme